MKISDLTTLGRTIDLRYPTNLAIALLVIAVGLVSFAAQVVGGASLTESIAAGAGAGFAVFFAWALARELDPDHELSAFVGAGLAIVGLPLLGTPTLLPVFWLLLVLRLVGRTVGLPAKPLDSLAVLGLGGWLTWQAHWFFGLVTAAAFLLDGLMSPPLRYQLLCSGVALAVAVDVVIIQAYPVTANWPDIPVLVVSVAVAGQFLIVIATSRDVQALGDATAETLNSSRVRAVQALALLSALGSAWWDGASGIVAFLPLWAAMAGVGLFRLFVLVPALQR